MRLWIRIVLGIAIATGALSSTVASQSQRSRPSPAPITEGRLTDPAPDLPRGTNLPPNWLADDQFLRWPYPPGDVAYTDLDGFRIKALINEITAISRKSRDDGNQYWGRIAGTAYERMTNEWTAAPVSSHRARTGADPGGRPATPVVPDVVGDDGERRGQDRPDRDGVPAVQLGRHQRHAQSGADVARHGHGRRLCRPQCQGKAVVVYGFPNPGGRGNTALTLGAVRRADEAGAAAVFMILGFPGNVMNEPQAGGTNAPANMPVFMVGDQDGRAIREMIERKESPTLRMRLAVEPRTG